MPRKTKPKEPRFFFPLVGLSVLLIVLGMIEVASISSAATWLPEGYRNPKSSGHDLFDLKEFRTLRRKRFDSKVTTSTPVSSSSSSSSSAATDASSASSEPIHSAAFELKWEDLTVSERETMRRQLRVYSCPQDAEASYKALCEKMLKAQEPQETKTGPKNPRQP